MLLNWKKLKITVRQKLALHIQRYVESTNRRVRSPALCGDLANDVGGRQLQSATASDELISRTHRPERYCVTQSCRSSLFLVGQLRVHTEGKQTARTRWVEPLSTAVLIR